MRSILSRFAKSRSRAARVHEQRSLRVESLERRQLLAAEVLQIQIENLAVEGGLAHTPFWIAAHDGNFEIGRLNESAADFGGLEDLAEEGDVSGLVNRFAGTGVGNDGVVTAPDGFAGAPVFEPGESVIQNLTVDDTQIGQYFSYASMVIPSNDAFVGNLNSRAFRLFDDAGQFLGPQTIVITGSRVWDAGTEVNDPNGAPAFSSSTGTSMDENGVIRLHEGLDDFIGVDLPTGGTLDRAFNAETPLARITISRASNPTGPLDSAPPSAQLDVETLNARADSHEVRVTYRDPSGVDLTSIGVNDLRITGPLLTQLEILSVSTDASPGTTPTEVTATYVVAPASGSFTALDNGTYGVVLLDQQINDTLGRGTDAALLGEFTVDAPVQLNVTYESLADEGGLLQTPLWIAAHDGNFEVARAGVSASNFGGLELIAEEGSPADLAARFAAESTGTAAVIFAPDGFAGAPVFEPGESVTQTFDIASPDRDRFFSYASMIIPSNDAFIANLDSRSIELFDGFGRFNGARTITIYGNDIWDAGTEVNDPNGSPAFSASTGASVDENGVIRRHTGLDDFIGVDLATGTQLQSAFDGMTPIGRITISLSDLPADAIDNRGPLVTLDATDITMTDATTHDLRVTYSDASGVDVTSIDVSDLTIQNRNGQTFDVVGVTTDTAIGEDSRTVTATYQIARSDGRAFSAADNELYFVSVNAGAVTDVLGNATPLQGVGSFEVQVAVPLQITVENLSVEGGLLQTPFWVAVHEGNFEIARLGSSAADFGGLEDIAEEGVIGPLATRFQSESGGVGGVITAPDGFAGAPVFEAGELATQTLNVFDTNANRFFSFASMVIPSNDAFLANLNARQYELFDSNGFFRGPQTITLYGRDIWDAGTEENALGTGAAFSAAGGTSVDENGVVTRHAGLDDFIGSDLADGTTLTSAFFANTPIARITIGLAGDATSPVDLQGPAATLQSDPVTTAGAAEHTFTVTYNDPAGVNLTTVDPSNLTIAGPLGRELVITDAVTNPSDLTGTPRSVSVTYTVTTADGPFTARDNGTYTVTTRNGGVADTLGNVAGGLAIGSIQVNTGVRIQVEIESLTTAGGLGQTPFWVGLHNGDFEVARGGVSASQFGGLEAIAEDGDASGLVARFAAESAGTDTVIAAPQGFAGAPVFEPGEIASQILEITGTDQNRFFSFASMVIPSNDAFVANLNSQRYELFDTMGNFNGARQITIYGRDVYDAGTEVNATDGGPAFTTDANPSTDENGLIRRHEGLDDFIGQTLPTGETLISAFSGLTPLATITITLVDPEADVCSGVNAACSVRSVSLQNAFDPADVNRDGRVSALDSLLVINFLSEFGPRDTIADEARRTDLDLDVGGDETITALDALLVINELNRRGTRLVPNGEPISAETFDAAITAFVANDFLDDDERDALTDAAALLF